ncbi:DUF4232 domain-containing protein [Cryptosporangium phraense]|uniref:DUF4232 domain-containing protein n=1 Tax=Cryptosporangium phraense TaxID=2593070 RepID=UPI0014781304|nr:DUF4232 domain-containing protein [Cryptosporangium phraense]
MRVRLVLVAALLLLAGCTETPDTLRPAAGPEAGPAARPAPAAPVATTPVPAPSSGPRCLDPGVEISVGETEGAAGLRLVTLQLRNCGTRPYTVQGYPVVTVLDADGRATDVRTFHGTQHVYTLGRPDPPPRRVTLAPGERARAALIWRNLTTAAETVVVGEYLRVAPAPGAPAHRLTLHVDPGNTGTMAVSPWAR